MSAATTKANAEKVAGRVYAIQILNDLEGCDKNYVRGFLDIMRDSIRDLDEQLNGTKD